VRPQRLAGVDPLDAGQGRQAPSEAGLVRALWHLVGLMMRAFGDELVKRPRPRRIFRYPCMLPAVGAVADYLGEYGALVRAAKAGLQWIAHHPVPA
jgi:hypothetical protein